MVRIEWGWIMARIPKIQRGDMVRIVWVDILEGSNEPTESADLGTWETVGFWVGRARKKNTAVTIIRYSRDPNEKGKPDPQSGYLCIPTVCVKAIYRLKIADIVQDAK